MISKLSLMHAKESKQNKVLVIMVQRSGILANKYRIST